MADRHVQILIVDDDAAYCRLIDRYLAKEGYRTRVAHSAIEMWPHMELTTLVLLDLHMPGSHGIDLARELRERYHHVGLIIVTGSTDEIDRIVGLEVGADDYVCKPVNNRELLARIRSVLRRVDTEQLVEGSVYRFGNYVMDIESRHLRVGDTAIALTGHEFNLLLMLADRPRRVFTREAISRKISDREWYPNDRSVDVLISKLRKKLASENGVDPIKSLRGVGYQFAIKVEKT